MADAAVPIHFRASAPLRCRLQLLQLRRRVARLNAANADRQGVESGCSGNAVAVEPVASCGVVAAEFSADHDGAVAAVHLRRENDSAAQTHRDTKEKTTENMYNKWRKRNPCKKIIPSPVYLQRRILWKLCVKVNVCV